MSKKKVCISLLSFLMIVAAVWTGDATMFIKGSATAFARPSVGDALVNSAVTTYHNDTARSGQYLNETVLNTDNVNVRQFGKRVSYPVDGQVYAQPLFVPNVIVNGSSYNVAFVATENDSVYAFDADRTSVTSALWQTSFISPPAVTTVPASDVYKKYPNMDIKPIVGITGTPVIDRGTGTLYVVAATKEGGNYFQRLHALDITTGRDKAGSPVMIKAAVAGSGYDNVHNVIRFNAQTANQRPALLLFNNVVYISWGAFGDTDPYHGWIMGYSYSGRAFQQISAGVYNDTPNGQEGGIWMSGGAPSADAAGNIYVITGNGTFDLNNGGADAGDSFIKLNTSQGLKVSDYFTPFNQACLDGRDADLGSASPLLLPDQPGSLHPHLLVGVGKEGRVYLVDRDNMGQFTEDPALQCNSQEERRTNIDHVVQELPLDTTGSLFGSASYWSGSANSGPIIYIGGFNDQLKAFHLDRGLISVNSIVSTPETFAFSGVTPSISSNGNANGTGIVWVNSPSTCASTGCAPQGHGTLRAYDATNISRELYNSEQDAGRDRVDNYTKFSVPTVAHGEVFVASQTSLSIYGLLSPHQPTLVSVDDSVQGSGQDQFNYTGQWGHCVNCNQANESMYNASNSWSKDTASYITFSFTGSQIRFYGVKRTAHGIGNISVDGGNETLMDFYSSVDMGNQLLWTSSPLAFGQHTVTVRVTGTKNVRSSDYYVAIDRVEVTE